MKIEVTEFIDEGEFNRLLDIGDKSIFRTFEWSRYRDAKYLIANDEGGKLVGCIHFYERMFLFRKTLISDSSPIAVNDTVRKEIIKSFKKLPGIKIIDTTYQDDKYSHLFLEAGFKHTDKATVIVDFDKYDDAWKFLHYDKRRRAKQASKEGIKIIDSTNDENSWRNFFGIYQIAGKNWGLKLLNKKEFMALKSLVDKNLVKLFLAKYGDDIISGSVVLNSGDTSIFYINATNPKFKNIQANVLLVWKIMEYAKTNGFKYFDLFGYDPHAKPGEKTYGINEFKMGFGGEIKKFYKFTDSNMFAIARYFYNKIRPLKKLYFFVQKRT